MLFGTAKFTEDNELSIGGVTTSFLIKKYGTPLFVYDVAHIRSKMRGFKQTFEKLGVKHKVVYASKAFCCLAMYDLLIQEGLGCDVVSGGEIYTALQGSMNPSDIEFHGNNKTKDELGYAVQENIGTIVVDNFYEIELLTEILKETGKKQGVTFRVTPGVNAETHDYILTGQVDSKFGFDVNSGQAEKALQLLMNEELFDLKGIHCHIGSQIFATNGFLAATEKMVALLTTWREKYGFVARELNMGGGFGVKYTTDDTPVEPYEFVEAIVTNIKELMTENHYDLPEIWIEPGRSLVAEAGTTLYEVGSIKRIPDVRTYVSVNGGMGDNIRPALYEAKYDGFLASRKGESSEVVTIAGKFCESGDLLIKDIELPILQATDILAISSTGAYGYSMANNYNRNPRPAVVFVENGVDTLVIRRETYADMMELDIPVR
jgi:diaminopimelate decarboxylase